MPHKFTIIIPTLNRAETLASALKTCVTQDYSDLEIIVSDNASTDQTQSVVASISDSRLRYINPGSRLGMSEHWDFALSHVTDGFVTVLGDDDGFIPGAIEALNRMIESTGTSAITWRKAEYCWPQHIIEDYRHYLEIPLDDSCQTLTSESQVRRVLEFQAPYNQLPCIYNSFISARAIDAFKKLNAGLMFGSLCPDIFSGFAIASVLERYVFSTQPFSINGAGSKSNGTAAFQEGATHPVVKDFLADTNFKVEGQLPLGVPELLILDAFVKVVRIGNAFPLSLVDNSRLIQSALANIAAAARSDQRHEAGLDAISAFATYCGLQERFKELKPQFKRTANSGLLQTAGIYDNGSRLILNGFNLRIENVFDAARRVGEIVKLKAERPALFDKLSKTKTPEMAIPLCAINGTGQTRLHLGCGSARFDGYVNVDFPPSEHNVMTLGADLFCDVTKIDLPDEVIDEIRLHHVFEHFNRVVALGLLIKWQSWLRVGGKLHIETPDFEASAADFLGATDLRRKLRTIRHLEGDQAAGWAYHVGQWFPERFAETLQKLGFSDIEIRQEASGHVPPLFNVQAIARKSATVLLETQYLSGCEILRGFMVADAEQPTWEVWTRQLAGVLDMNVPLRPTILHPPERSDAGVTLAQAAQSVPQHLKPLPQPTLAQKARGAARNFISKFSKGPRSEPQHAFDRSSSCQIVVDKRVSEAASPPGAQRPAGSSSTGDGSLPRTNCGPAISSPANPELLLPLELCKGIPLNVLQFINRLFTLNDPLPVAERLRFNQGDRDLWVADKAKTVPAGARVLDIGAGPCPYRGAFAHCDYQTHDFKQYEGYKDRERKEGLYGEITYVSDIVSIPVPDSSFDVILCTEVLEHVPEPIAALREMARILRPGGRLFLTAPLGSGLHQEPYHFYGGYTPHWYRHFCNLFGLDVVAIIPNGGFFKHLAQECARVAWTMPEHRTFHAQHAEAVGTLFGELLPRYLFALEGQFLNDKFAVGYHVEAVKRMPL